MAGAGDPNTIATGRDTPAASAAVLAALARRPKVELHRHLEVSLRVATACELARRHEPDAPFCDHDWPRDSWTF
jgi:hypothetical protein